MTDAWLKIDSPQYWGLSSYNFRLADFSRSSQIRESYRSAHPLTRPDPRRSARKHPNRALPQAGPDFRRAMGFGPIPAVSRCFGVGGCQRAESSACTSGAGRSWWRPAVMPAPMSYAPNCLGGLGLSKTICTRSTASTLVTSFSRASAIRSAAFDTSMPPGTLTR